MVWGLPPHCGIFPHPSTTLHEGLLAYGGDLSASTLKLAYHYGIFPWYSEDDPILWWHTQPRCVLYPDEVKVSKSMRAFMRKTNFQLTLNKSFEEVISKCSTVTRKGQDSTWITNEMMEAYINLHHHDLAHSIEVWDNEVLVGGLYGVVLGRIFYGESMFAHKTNASKMALILLARLTKSHDFTVIDCQQSTEHLLTLGAREIERPIFQKHLFQNRLYCLKHGDQRSWQGSYEILPNGDLQWMR